MVQVGDIVTCYMRPNVGWPEKLDYTTVFIRGTQIPIFVPKNATNFRLRIGYTVKIIAEHRENESTVYTGDLLGATF